MTGPSNAYRPGVYTVDLKKPGGEILSLTHRADAQNRALERAINDGWFECRRFSYSCLIYGPLALQ